MEFIKDSKNIRVFPASLRTYDGMGKYTTENNLTGIPRSVTDFDSYLLSRTKESSKEKPFRFVIHGYYFEMDDMGFASAIADERDANMYIHIKVENGQEYSRLVDYEDGGTDLDNPEGEGFIFRALMIDNTALDSVVPVKEGEVTTHFIYTLRLTDENGDLAKESFIRDLPDSIGDRTGKDVGCFEVDATGSMGFSQPIYLKAVGGFKPVNTIFWGSQAPHEAQTINGVTQDIDLGDIFFKL